ncbi:MAG TPA: ABC transporter substrate-binding protein [Gaiellaceae bacterium]|nr:ABC transporter substrate-binding protein [Gaiellaceae bacterium]
MDKRLMLSIASLVTGAALLAGASVASPGAVQGQSSPQPRKGGILKFTLFAGIENIDPQRSYYLPEWQYEWLTGRMLLTFAHKRGALSYRLVDDGARSYTVSNNGRTYTFHIRRGMKLSNGAPLNAKNYEHALLRVLNPAVGSPLASLLTDPASVEIVGATDYNAGRTDTVPGIFTRGSNTLVVKLVRANPLLPTLLALPPTGAIANNTPFRPITSVSVRHPLPAGGRYYVQEYVPDRSIKIRKNRFYKPLGAAPTPGIVDGFDYTIGVRQDQALQLVQNGQSDWAADGLPETAWSPLFAQYGTKGRARVFPTRVVDIAFMNNATGPFANVNVRKSIEWGIDRSALAGVFGSHGRSPQCSLLTPAIPGYRKCTIYPNTPDLPRARSLASGHTGDHINFWYTSSTIGTRVHQLATSQLNAIGFDNIDHRAFSSGLFSALARRGHDCDLAILGWGGDFPDLYGYVNTLFEAIDLDPEADRLLRAAARLTGQKRAAAYGKLDLTLQRRWAPIAVIDRRNDREFFSARIDTRSIVQSPIYEIDLGKLAAR